MDCGKEADGITALPEHPVEKRGSKPNAATAKRAFIEQTFLSGAKP
jgi:hypothetical protein